MDKSPKKVELFSWAGLEFFQDNLVHKIGTDAVLLASWIPKIIDQPTSIMDVGTGTGFLAMVLAKKFPDAKVNAMDVDEVALTLARRNILNSNLDILLSKEDILHRMSAHDIRYDLVVSNPPYYHTHNPSESDHKKRAKHSNGQIALWMHPLLEKTNTQGHCCVVVPANDASNWIHAANEKKWYVTNRLEVYSFADDPLPVRSLLHFTHHLTKPQLSKIALYSSVNTYTEQYLNFSRIVEEGSEITELKAR